MNDNPTRACNKCAVPVELERLKKGLCPSCAPPPEDTSNPNPWEVEVLDNFVEHFLEIQPKQEIDSYCEFVVEDFNNQEVTWSVSLRLDATGSQIYPPFAVKDISGARQTAIQFAIHQQEDMLKALKEALIREQAQ